jgi:hypothetical protein
LRLALVVATLLAVVPTAALAQEAGKVAVRGNAGADLGQDIDLANPNLTFTPSAFIEGGLGYFVIQNLEADIDVSAHLVFGKPISFGLTVTPGVRYQVGPQFMIRAGIPIKLFPERDAGILVGAALTQPIGGNATFVLGVDYTYLLIRPGADPSVQYYGILSPHVGIQTHF